MKSGRVALQLWLGSFDVNLHSHIVSRQLQSLNRSSNYRQLFWRSHVSKVVPLAKGNAYSDPGSTNVWHCCCLQNILWRESKLFSTSPSVTSYTLSPLCQIYTTTPALYSYSIFKPILIQDVSDSQIHNVLDNSRILQPSPYFPMLLCQSDFLKLV